MEEAEELCVQVTEIRKKTLGQEHADMLICMNNLALIFKQQGRLKEPEELEVHVVKWQAEE
jgi:Tetratricopeptide repeat